MTPCPPPSGDLDPAVRRELVAFLRAWLPEHARRSYRQMMIRDPENWSRDPHFAGGVILRHALRGNGMDERALRTPELEALWPDLLKEAVQEEGADP